MSKFTFWASCVLIASGDYAFHWSERSATKEAKARYSIVFTETNRGWLIANHHSSTPIA